MSEERGGRQGRGAKGGDKGGQGQRRTFFRRRRVCKFCTDRVDYINYKDVTAPDAVLAGARQDSAATDLGHVRDASAGTPDRDQARTSDCACSVRFGVTGLTWKSFSKSTSRTSASAATS